MSQMLDGAWSSGTAASDAGTQAAYLAGIGQAVVATDDQHRVQYWNELARQLLGWDEEDALGRQLWSWLCDTEQLAESIRNSVDAGRAVNDQLLLRRSDGDLQPVDVVVTPWCSDGRTAGYVVALTDATAVRRLQHALTRETRRARVLQEVVRRAMDSTTTEDAVQGAVDLLVDRTEWDVGHVYWVDDGWSGPVIGLDRLGAAGVPFVDATDGLLDDEEMPSLVRDCAESGDVRLVPDLVEDPTYRRRDVALGAGLRSAAFLPVRYDGRTLAVVELYARRATDASTAEREWLRGLGTVLEAAVQGHEQAREVRRSRDLFAGIVQAGVAAKVVIGSDDRVQYANAAAEELVGRTDLKGRSFTEVTLLDGDTRREIAGERHPVRRVRAGDRLLRGEQYVVVRPDGEEAEVVLNAAATRGRGGEVVVALLDISPLKRAQRELERKTAEAEAANNAKSEFLSRMSHELRTPMNAIVGFADLIGRKTEDEDLQRFGQHISSAADHLVRLIDDVLDIARIETGKLTLSVEPVNVTDIAIEVCDLLAPQARARQIAVHPPRTVGPVYAQADMQRLRQVLVNLVSNAVKYGHEGGNVEVAVTATADSVCIDVADDGPGIPHDQQARVFEPFDRLGQEHGEVEGVGLGLTVSKEFIESMGGTLTLDSEPGVGTTFTVVARTSEGVARSTGRGQGPSRATGRLSVLAIEDNPTNVVLLQEILAETSEHELRVETTGEAGVAAALAAAPDVVLLDLDLPDISGLEVLQALREDHRGADLPVVVLTADATEADRAALEALDIVAYHTKPLDVGALLRTLDRIEESRR